MTGLPASTIGLVDRGFLAAGMAADITVFDPATVIDHATFEQPTLPSEGIRHVLVNGRVAMRDGKPTGEQGGRALLRARHMPSRPMQLATARRASAKGSGLTFDIRQDPRARLATGTFRWKDRSSSDQIETTSLGLLQVADGWASLTARARVGPSRDERSVTITIDRGDPSSPGAGVLVVNVDGATERRLLVETKNVAVSSRAGSGERR